jgi:hypothetical protein
VYGKCFYDETNTEVSAFIYIETSVDRTILDSDWTTLEGGATGEFLNADTPEDDRAMYERSVSSDKTARIYSADYGQWVASAPDGTTLRGDNMVGAKRGDLDAGNGPWPSGNACLLATSAETLG